MSLTVAHSEFINNNATVIVAMGAAIYTTITGPVETATVDVTIAHSKFINNGAYYSNSTILVSGMNVNIGHSTFIKNTGYVVYTSFTNTTISQSVFVDNAVGVSIYYGNSVTMNLSAIVQKLTHIGMVQEWSTYVIMVAV